MESRRDRDLKFNLIAAACENMGIGYQGRLPWNLEREFAYFDKMTQLCAGNKVTNNVVVMGRLTWEAFPENDRPLKNRINVVLSRATPSSSWPAGVYVHRSWDEMLSELKSAPQFADVGEIWICGGSNIYKMAMDSPYCHRIYLTRIQKHFQCDAFFPSVDEALFELITVPEVSQLEQEENGINYTFQVYVKRLVGSN